jgi:hypothetical protein
MRFKYLDGVLGLIALFTTMEPILRECSRNLNQGLDAWGVRLMMLRCQANSYNLAWSACLCPNGFSWECHLYFFFLI